MNSTDGVSNVKFWSWVTGAFFLGSLLGIVLGVAGLITLMALIG